VRTLFIQHDPASDPGLVGEALRARGAVLDLLPLGRSIDDGRYHGPFPRARDFELLVPLGAIWSVYDRAAVGTWIDRELALLREADEAGIPVLGICFGGQALAAAHGAEVVPAPRTEIGMTRVGTTVPELIPDGPWMQWHSDRYELPEGAVELARNEVSSQAFRLRRNLGLQFHPEVDADIVTTWIDLGGDDAVKALEDASGRTVDEVLAELRDQHDRCRRDVEVLVDGFLRDVAGLA
jgi:GMP synthase-like glutamine amidotransferase